MGGPGCTQEHQLSFAAKTASCLTCWEAVGVDFGGRSTAWQLSADLYHLLVPARVFPVLDLLEVPAQGSVAERMGFSPGSL